MYHILGTWNVSWPANHKNHTRTWTPKCSDMMFPLALLPSCLKCPGYPAPPPSPPLTALQFSHVQNTCWCEWSCRVCHEWNAQFFKAPHMLSCQKWPPIFLAWKPFQANLSDDPSLFNIIRISSSFITFHKRWWQEITLSTFAPKLKSQVGRLILDVSVLMGCHFSLLKLPLLNRAGMGCSTRIIKMAKKLWSQRPIIILRNENCGVPRFSCHFQ